MKILIAGDFFIKDSELINLDKGLKEIFSQCDYRIVNYEGPVSRNDYSNLPVKSGPRLMQSFENVQILKELKVDALTLANNHIMDYGTEGYYETVNRLSDFALMGAGNWEEAYRLHTVVLGGVTLGFLNLSELQFGILSDEWSQDRHSVGCAWINHRIVNKLILEKKQEVDYLIAIVHAGLEMINVPLPEWRDRYKEMIDLGCDAVIAHHPHVVQGFEIYNNKPIAYSLGNFCFSSLSKFESHEWNKGALAILNIDNNAISMSMIGCQKIGNQLQLENESDSSKRFDYLCKKLEQPEYIHFIDRVCKNLQKDYWNLFAMGGAFTIESLSLKNIARFLLHRYDYVHLLNNFQCESHRWCIRRFLISK